MVRDTESNDDIKLLLMEEQTLLSRERTMHSYMQTGLAFTSVGLAVMKFLSGLLLFLRRAGLYYPGRPSHSRIGEAVCALQESNPKTPRKGDKARV